MGPLLSETGGLVTQDMEEAEVLNASFASAFTSKTSLQELQVPVTRAKGWSKEDGPLVEADQVREYLSKQDIQKSMGPDGMHPRVLRKLSDVIAWLLSKTFDLSWRVGEAPKACTKAGVVGEEE